MRRLALIALLLALAAPTAALAVAPDEMLKDPALEARARHLSRRTCAAWSARTSRSTIRKRSLAHDLRLLVRERLKKGDSDQQVLDFLVARYGEFVLLKPRFELHTLLLWGLPPAGAGGRHDRAGRDGAPPQARQPADAGR